MLVFSSFSFQGFGDKEQYYS